MGNQSLDAVTGAFGYSGAVIAERLLAAGRSVRTLTGQPHREHPLQGRVEALPFRWDNQEVLARSLDGVSTLYNTYWIRFARGTLTFDIAVANLLELIRAAERAGVRRIVHVSITNPTEDSPLPYFRGKALVERAIRDSSLSYAILRPTVLFGGGRDVLLNNIACMLRRMPVFGILGGGAFPIQPVHVEDLADLAVEQGSGAENVTFDAVGPEVFMFGDLVRLIRKAVRSHALLVPAPPALALFLTGLMGWVTRDVVLTRDEVTGLMAGLLVSKDPPTGSRGLREWTAEHASELGVHYASEVGRHFRRG